jgi:hypothetical protein
MPTGMVFLPPSTSIPNVGQPAVAGSNPVSLVWQVGLLQPGFSGTITFQARIFQFASGQVYTNGVCITGDNGLNNNNCGSATSV